MRPDQRDRRGLGRAAGGLEFGRLRRIGQRKHSEAASLSRDAGAARAAPRAYVREGLVLLLWDY